MGAKSLTRRAQIKRCWPKLVNVWGKFLTIQKCSSQNVECSFDNNAETFLPKVRKLFAQSPKMNKKYKFFKKNPRKVGLKNSISLKHFHSLEKHLQQNGWAQNMPVLTGRLVTL